MNRTGLGYDFHLHSCLSPCADDDMTPYNLVNMAKLLQLDIIALTDHNSCKNCAAAMQAGIEAEIVVIPGMELCTAEEIHAVCLFPSLENALDFSDYVYTTLPPINNQPDVFGRQVIMDCLDGETGIEEKLLVTASAISIDELPALVKKYSGVSYPAHIDRASYSVIATFGTLTRDMGFACAEVSKNGQVAALIKQHPDLAAMRMMRSSDAHRLEDMSEALDHIHPAENTPEAVIRYLRNKE